MTLDRLHLIHHLRDEITLLWTRLFPRSFICSLALLLSVLLIFFSPFSLSFGFGCSKPLKSPYRLTSVLIFGLLFFSPASTFLYVCKFSWACTFSWTCKVSYYSRASLQYVRMNMDFMFYLKPNFLFVWLELCYQMKVHSTDDTNIGLASEPEPMLIFYYHVFCCFFFALF